MSDKTIRESLDELMAQCGTFAINTDHRLTEEEDLESLEWAKESFLKRIENPWISVKDRLPEHGEPVWCGGVYLTGDFLQGVGDLKNHGKFDVYNPNFQFEVTHWQPLPEPPK